MGYRENLIYDCTFSLSLSPLEILASPHYSSPFYSDGGDILKKQTYFVNLLFLCRLRKITGDVQEGTGTRVRLYLGFGVNLRSPGLREALKDGYLQTAWRLTHASLWKSSQPELL